MEKLNHKWISAKAYSDATGLGVEKVKQFIRSGKLEGQITEDGYYKVKIYNNDSVSREVYEREVERRVKAETMLKSVKNLLQEVEYE